MLKAILFDLDGTITDSAPIIMESLDKTMREVRGVVRPIEDYQVFVGPPLQQTMRTLGVPEDEIDMMVTEYRTRYARRMLATPLFDGIEDVLRTLCEAGIGLAVATSKKQSVALTVADHLGITKYFVAICGANEDESRGKKHEMVEDAIFALERGGFLDQAARVEPREHVDPMAGSAELLDDDRPFRTDVVMVGDRIFDINGATVHGLNTVLVTWGAAPDEERAMAWKVVETMDDLTKTLLAS